TAGLLTTLVLAPGCGPNNGGGDAGPLPDGALPDGALPDGALPDGALPDNGFVCIANDLACVVGTPCCSGVCDAVDNTCTADLGQCVVTGNACVTGSECCSGRCEGDVCAPPGSQCEAPGALCTTSAD